MRTFYELVADFVERKEKHILRKLKIMEWNIHQQGRQYNGVISADGQIPLWIIDEIPADVNIVVFTEFNCHAKNIEKFYDGLIKKGFSYSTTNYSCSWSNDILIAVRGEEIVVKEVSYVKAYPDKPNTSFEIEWDAIPENLRVDICIAETDIHLWGIRIKDLKSEYPKRKIEMETVMEWLKEVAGINLLVGDFNNLRENTTERNWNLEVLDNLIGKEYIRATPAENHSWGISMEVGSNKCDGYIKNDHLIYSSEITAKVEQKYKWGYLNKCNYILKKSYRNKLELDIPVGEPDHGILIGVFQIFEDKDYKAIDAYFPDGGETYTLEELLARIEKDIGYEKEDAKQLLEKCVDRCFVTECGNNIYTR